MPASPSPTQVQIRMRAASLNSRDLQVLEDAGASRDGLIPLSAGVGDIIALGRLVTGWKIGDRVSPGVFPKWQSGLPIGADLTHALGAGSTDGVLCDRFLAEAGSLVAVPSHLTLPEAAALPYAAVTAWHALFDRGKLQPSETVLLHGLGDVSLLCMQLAIAAGARVIVIATSDSTLTRARRLGAWQTISGPANPMWHREVMNLTENRGVDHVLERSGTDTYDRSIGVLAQGGRIAHIGTFSSPPYRLDTSALPSRNASIHGICVGSVEHFRQLCRFLSLHRLRPVVDKSFPFEQAPDAYAYFQASDAIGAVVIDFD